MKKAIITGITGQDGSYLAELLLEKGYEVHGIKRRSSLFNTSRVNHLYHDPQEKDVRLFLHYGDLTDTSNLTRIVQEVQPDEIYNLGAQSHVGVSFENPEYTGDTDAMGTLRLLEAIRILKLEKKTKFYQASTSELYGKVQSVPQSEKTPFYPRSPYAVAKLYAYWITVNYREAYGIHASNGILFNHESPRRGETFVTRKITRAVSQIALGMRDKLYLGNIDSQRDWGHAKDYVEGMWRIVQHQTADDFVLATGVTTTIRDFVKKSFSFIGIDLVFSGKGQDEVAQVNKCSGEFQLPKGKVVLAIDPRYYRATEVDLLIGDSTKAREKLKWQPQYNLQALIDDMMKADLELFRREKYILSGGHKASESHQQ